MERGACTFAQKVMRAEAAGAAAVIIIQTLDIWPYTMTDSTGEGNAISIPAFMMSVKHGKGYTLRSRRTLTCNCLRISPVVVGWCVRESPGL